jgi:hypothetical protein
MIHDMCRAMKLPQDTFDRVRGDSESLGGLVLELAGEFPKQNEIIHCGDLISPFLKQIKTGFYK